MSIELSNPWWLLLIPAVAAGLIASGRVFRIRNKRKKTVYMIVRGVIALLLILTLCGLSVKLRTKEVTTIFLVDMSDSNEENIEDIETYLRDTIEDMPKKNQTGIVAFGDDVLIDQFVTDQKIFSELASQPVSTATNLEKAVSTALTIFPEDTAKRLVLITDGLENAGSIEKMAGTVSASDIEVKVVKLEQNVGEEVYVSDLELPDYVHVGDTFQVKVTIESNVDTQAVVSLYSGRTLKGQSTVSLTSGKNQFVFQDTGESNGTQDYHVLVEPVNDTMSMNNEYCAFTQVESDPKLLLVEGSQDEGAALAAVLDAAGVQYDRKSPEGVPEELSDMIQYKAVILVNVHARDLRQGFLDNLESYVRDYAGGLICTGGDNSYAMGSYQDTALETVLPVNMYLEGEDQVATMAVVMVIDHSGSMSTAVSSGGASCLDLAKEAAIEGVKTLQEQDEVGVLAFDDTYGWAVPLQNVTDTDAINKEISGIEVGGGTSIYPALEEAAQQLQQSDAQIKHIILLTDGQDYYDAYSDVIDTINDSGITLSTVAVGSESDQALLQSLADQCGGRFYYTDINSGIPKIFAQEIIISGKSYLVNEEFTPVITSRSEILEGLTDDGVPTLLGYIGSSAKSQATVILQSEEGDPILTTWQYGLGRTIAWNSDATNEWSANWATWDQYVQFWDNMINYVVSNTSLDGESLEVAQEGSSAVVTYTTEQYDEDTQVTVICTDDEGNAQELTLDPVAPGEYQAVIDMEDVGIYTISLQNTKGEELQSSLITAAAMQYSPEYRFDQTADGLDAFVSQTDGAYITYEDDVFADPLEMVRARISLAVPLLLAALLLFMLDIAARRMNLDYTAWIAGRFRRSGRQAAADDAGHRTRGGIRRRSAVQAAGKSGQSGRQTEAGAFGQSGRQTEAGISGQSGWQTEAGISGQSGWQTKAGASEQSGQAADDGKRKKKSDRKKSAEKKRKQNAAPEENLDMDALLKKKEDRNL